MKYGNVAEDRSKVVDYLESQLVGPAGGENEIFESLRSADKPHSRYLMGALFPLESCVEKDIDEEQFHGPDESGVSHAYQQQPASCGLSLVTTADTLTIRVSAAIYEGVPSGWQRRALASRDDPLVLVVDEIKTDSEIFDGLAMVRSHWRRHGNKRLVTVTLINNQQSGNSLAPAVDTILHQVWFSCAPVSSRVEPYPVSSMLSWDEEEEELALTYQSKQVFGIGHGCSVKWESSELGNITLVETSFLPRYEVPNVTTAFSSVERSDGIDLNDQPVLGLAYLADQNSIQGEVVAGLSQFIDHYEKWVIEQDVLLDNETQYQLAAKRLSTRLQRAVSRMRRGVAVLAEEPDAFRCFRLANLAMLMQIIHSSAERPKGEGFCSEDYPSLGQAASVRWRPFQLAFQLLSIESTFNENSIDRDLVDLIWFPTGGGKTEAYLALAAFELFRRRIVHGDQGGGTAIIKRYTLRLLTAQQFERCSALVCACELLRRESEGELGAEPITIGLWVGGSSTPNKFSEDSERSPGAFQKYKTLVEDFKPINTFQLRCCPWCQTAIVPDKIQKDQSAYGVRATESSFTFFCPDAGCCFNDELPIQVIDEGLYMSPPSFLIGTIDKFARLAWLDTAGAFFGAAGTGNIPPSLIIQDELHLISGPLGTIAGLYEAAFDTVLGSRGARPKYIAATATIRRAADQARKLYARRVDVFPPSGARCTDSFFSREEENYVGKGRLYLGVMGQYHNPVTSLVHTTGAIAQAPIELTLSPAAMDAYWTSVIFHNSRRELGKTMTLCRDDIPSRAKVIATDQSRLRSSYNPVEMSANIPSWQIPEVLGQLAVERPSDDAIDALPCTNMFSVGVDVARLGLIVMNGQPKTTAEYIQASSRVGRKSGRPGLVVAFYSSTKSRDRSHYETFAAYHQALYRSVEPTSVTPSAMPALERALHAALVIVMRHAAALGGNDMAGQFDSAAPDQQMFLDTFRKRLRKMEPIDKRAQAEMMTYLETLVMVWDEEAASSRNGTAALVFEGTKPHRPLLKSFTPGEHHRPELPWLTLNSMRNVDVECSLFVTGESEV